MFCLLIFSSYLFSCSRSISLNEIHKANQFKMFYRNVIKTDNEGEIEQRIRGLPNSLKNGRDGNNRNIYMIATMACHRDDKDSNFLAMIFDKIDEVFETNKIDHVMEKDEYENNLAAYLVAGGFNEMFSRLVVELVNTNKDVVSFVSNISDRVPTLGKRYEYEELVDLGEIGLLEIATEKNPQMLGDLLDIFDRAGDKMLAIKMLGNVETNKIRTNFFHIMFSSDMRRRYQGCFVRFIDGICDLQEGRQKLLQLLQQKDSNRSERPLASFLRNMSFGRGGDANSYRETKRELLGSILRKVVRRHLVDDSRERIALLDSSIERQNEVFLDEILKFLSEQGIKSADAIDSRTGECNFMHKVCRKRSASDSFEDLVLSLDSLKRLRFHNSNNSNKSSFLARTNSPDNGSMTPLHLFAHHSQQVIREHLDTLYYPNVCLKKNREGMNALHWSIKQGNEAFAYEIISRLKSTGHLEGVLRECCSSVQEEGLPEMKYPTPLKLCVLYERNNIAKKLLAEGADVDGKSGCTTAVLWAVRMAGIPLHGLDSPHEEMVNLLLSANAKYRKKWNIRVRSLAELFGSLLISAAGMASGTISGVGGDRVTLGASSVVNNIDELFIHTKEKEYVREMSRDEKIDLYKKIEMYDIRGDWKRVDVRTQEEITDVDEDMAEESEF